MKSHYLNKVLLGCFGFLLFLQLSFAQSKSSSPATLSLPDPITSFGACKAGKYLYVYGGHKGEAHVYSKDNHSRNFVRLDLKKRTKWEKLPFNESLQGFGMSSHNGKIYIVGGSQATNKSGEESNLSSLAEVSVFDSEKKTWTPATPLPEPRSSHEAVIHNNKLYVIGGWNMKNGKGLNWHHHGLVADLSEKPLKWTNLPKTEWKVRANSAAVVKNKLYVIGGLDDNGTTNAVRILDLGLMKWSNGPPYPGSGRLKAFGSAACNMNGRLLASAYSSQPRILSKNGKEWKDAPSKLNERRFFHRIVPIDKRKAFFLGGANFDGHLDSTEILELSKAKEESEEKDSSKQHDDKTKQSFNWPGFRGDGNSHSPAKELPLNWADDKNLAWRTKLSGYGQSTPVTWGDNVFTTSTKGEWSETLVAHCHRVSDGKLLWEKTLPSPVKIKRSKMVSQAAPSPVVDQDALYLFFESGQLLALDHHGKELWQRKLTKEYGAIEGNHGIGSSLFQTDEKIGLLVDHSGPSYLVRIDKKTGKTDWKVDRPKRVSWSTPTISSDGKEEILYLSSNGIVEAYAFDTGKQIWKMEGIEGNTVASPTVTENYVIIGSSAPDQSMALHRQVELPSNSRVAWKAEDASSSFGSPLATKDYLYLVNRAGVATCHDLKTGKKVWNLRLPGSCWASPMHALGRIYFFTKDGKTIVIGSNGSDKVLAENELSIEGRIYGVSAVNKAFVLRTGTELICVGSISNST